MIDPIHNQAYQEYTRVSRAKPQDVEQKFPMDSAMQENPSSHSSTDGVIYEPSNASKSDSDKAVSSDSGHAADSQTQKASTTETTMQIPQKATAASSESFGTVLKRLVQNVLQGLKKFLSAIWESKPAEDTTNADVINEDTITDDSSNILKASDAEIPGAEMINGETADVETMGSKISGIETVGTDTTDIENFDPQTIDPALDADIKKALKSKDTDSFRALLSRDGHRVPARNTSLLTYYDSKGNLVNLDPSDQYRILHGDRNSQKL